MVSGFIQLSTDANMKPACQSAGVTRVRWSDVDTTHVYESDTVVEDPRPYIQAQNRASRKWFRNEPKAIHHDRVKKQQQLWRQYGDLLPELNRLDLTNKSIEELEAIQSELIDALDRRRQVNPETGDLIRSVEYRSLEHKLMLVIEASECIARRTHVDSLLESAPVRCRIKRSRKVSIPSEGQTTTCFSFIFKRSQKDEYIRAERDNQPFFS